MMTIFLTEIYELLKIISKVTNYREPKTTSWKKYKVNIIIGIDNIIEAKLASEKKCYNRKSKKDNFKFKENKII